MSELPINTGDEDLDITKMAHLTRAEKTMRQRIAWDINERCGQQRLYQNPESSVAALLARIDPELPGKFAELYDAEIAELQGLDPDTATDDDIHEIWDRYEAQRNRLLNLAPDA